MKKFKIAICAVLVLFCSLIFVGCNEAEVETFNADLFKVAKAEVVYDGNSHIYEVEYKGVDLDVTYSEDKVVYKDADQFSFKDAGTYNLYYKVSAEGYETYASSEAVEFKILPKTATIKVKDTVICKTDKVTKVSPEYTIDGLIEGDEINVSFGIGKNANSGVAYDKENVVYGQKYNYDISYENHKNYDIVVDSNVGSIVVKDYFEIIKGDSVAYRTSLQDAYELLGEYDDTIIKLHKDIVTDEMPDETDIVLRAVDKNYKFTIDLNGHIIQNELDFKNCKTNASGRDDPNNFYEFGIDVKIIDSSEAKTGTVGTYNEVAYYGILVKGNEKVKVTLSGVKCIGSAAGIYYNGVCAGASITASNCQFEGYVVGIDGGCMGVNLPGQGEYTFTNCTFTGETAYYTKDGYSKLYKCTFIATGANKAPEHNGDGSNVTGSALVIDSAVGYGLDNVNTLSVQIYGGVFMSDNGFCIQEISTEKEPDTKICYASVSIFNSEVFKVEYRKYTIEPIYSENDIIVVIE